MNTPVSSSLNGAQRHQFFRSFAMNNTNRITLAAALLAVAQGAFAHDPAEHAREAAEAKKGANCAAMKDMDMSKTDPNDPVMKAMMAKCNKATQSVDHKDMKGMKMDMPADATKKPHTHETH
jgi:hypothetical protein